MKNKILIFFILVSTILLKYNPIYLRIESEQQKAIVIGATSGIGNALTKVLLEKGYIVGATGRRINLLDDLKNNYADIFYTKQMDITKTEDAIKSFNELVQKMNGVDVVVINAGVGFVNPDLDLDKELQTIAVNVTGFVAMANVAYKYFEQRKSGHLVGVSSIAGLISNSIVPAYSASKAFEINYLNSLRAKTCKDNLPITITEILPGFVDTKMINKEEAFWVATPEEAAKQIYGAIINKKNKAYITKRWALVAWVLKFIPYSILNRFL
ncbi:SDR family NAD(P)-dependent oxidoreductase [Candidatus Dependentiae bacterium]|nr:SDR family NAD(P)-dependent oxidoreductase [Candidatus Dependentiae bacterium]